MNRRDFLKVGALSLLASNIRAEEKIRQEIIVNVPSYNLKLMEGDNELLDYTCRVGKAKTPTPIGEGNVIKKRDTVVFRYLSGDRKGQVIRYSYLNPEDRTIKMPYDKMKGMDFEINGLMTGPIIHSTTDYWTLGTARSHGCVGMEMDDMLELYEASDANPMPKMINTYQTLFFDEESDKLKIWCDIYSRGTNSVEAISPLFQDENIDKTKLESKLKTINQELMQANKDIQNIINDGRDPKDQLHRLSKELLLEDLLK